MSEARPFPWEAPQLTGEAPPRPWEPDPLEHDGELSGAHFELHWTGSRCFLRDLDSIRGTEVGGQMVKEAELWNGTPIHAGHTTFCVYFEGFTPPHEEGASRLVDGVLRSREKQREAAAGALFLLRAEAVLAPLYAVLDASRSPRIMVLLRESVETHRSLLEGLEADTRSETAPYVVGPLREDSRLLERLVLEGWGKGWGIFCTSRERYDEVRRHWRRFLMVGIASRTDRVFFRFYDPQVLSSSWAVLTPVQKGYLLSRFNAVLLEEPSWEIARLVAPEGTREPFMRRGGTMFRFTLAQVDALRAWQRTEKSLRHVLPGLRRTFPEQTAALDDDELLAVVHEARVRAQRYRIESDAGTWQLITLRLVLGPGLYKLPFFEDRMLRGHYTPEVRLRAFVQDLKHELKGEPR